MESLKLAIRKESARAGLCNVLLSRRDIYKAYAGGEWHSQQKSELLSKEMIFGIPILLKFGLILITLRFALHLDDFPVLPVDKI